MQVITIKDNLEYLRQLSMPIDILNDDNLVNDIKTLELFCINNDVLAMVSVQLGIPKRIIY